jgi:hypothetical protein
MRSFGHIGKLQRSDRCSSQDDDFMAESSQDPADLTILSFAQRNIDLGTAFADFANGRTVDARDSFCEINAPLKPAHGLLFDLPGNHDKVRLGDTVFRVC